MAESITRIAENDGRKRIGDSVGKAYFGNADEGTDGRTLSVYKDNADDTD